MNGLLSRAKSKNVADKIFRTKGSRLHREEVMTVTVFTNPNNPQCEATEQELSKLGVRYVAVDLTQNPSTFEQIKDAGFKQIPVVISPNSSWSGHRPDLIRQLAQSIAA